MRILRRCSQLAVLLALVFAISAGTAVYQVREDASVLRASFSGVLQYYRERVPVLMADLSQSPDLNDDERGAIERLQQSFSALPSEPHLQTDTKVLADQLSALRTLLIELAAKESVASTDAFAQLKTLSNGMGEISDIVYKYNQEVLVWNQRDTTFLGQLVSSTLRLEKILMVNADGSTELLPTIRL